MRTIEYKAMSVREFNALPKWRRRLWDAWSAHEMFTEPRSGSRSIDALAQHLDTRYANAMEAVAAAHPRSESILIFGVETYLNDVPDSPHANELRAVAEDARWTLARPLSTVTGRWSAKGPNLQNMPRSK